MKPCLDEVQVGGVAVLWSVFSINVAVEVALAKVVPIWFVGGVAM
jgi:hypothetical protein